MSNKILVQTQNFFVDTSKPEIGECRNATFVLPQGLMDCDESQEMRLTLNAFSMRNNWYRINQNNQVYFIVGKNEETPPTFVSTRVQLGAGNYELFSQSDVIGTPASRPSQSLGNNIEFGIQRALQRTHAAAPSSFATTASWDSVSGKYLITIDTSARKSQYAGGVKLVCFTIPQGTVIDQGNLAYAILNTPHHTGFLPPNEDKTSTLDWVDYMNSKPSGDPSHSGANWSIKVINNKPPHKAPVPAPGFQVEAGDFVGWMSQDSTALKFYFSEIVPSGYVEDSAKNFATVTCSIASFNGGSGSTGPSAQLFKDLVGDIGFYRQTGSQFIRVVGTTNRQVKFATSTPSTTAGWKTAAANTEGIIPGQQIDFPNDSGYSISGNHVKIDLGGTLDATHFVMEEPYDIDFVTSGYADMHLFHTVPTTGVNAVGAQYNQLNVPSSDNTKFITAGMVVTSTDAGLPAGTTVSSITSQIVSLSQASAFNAQELTLASAITAAVGETVTQGITLTLSAAATFTANAAVDQGTGTNTGTVTAAVTVASDEVVVTVTKGTFTTGTVLIGGVSYTITSLVNNVGTVRDIVSNSTDVKVNVTSGGFVGNGGTYGDAIIDGNAVTVSTVAAYTEAFAYTFTTVLTATSQESNTIWLTSNLTAAQKLEVIAKTVNWSGKAGNSEHVVVDSVAEYGNPAKTLVVTDQTEEIPVDSSVIFRPTNSGDNPTFNTDAFQSTFEVLGGCYEDRGNIPGLDFSAQFDNMRGLMQVTPPVAPDTKFICEAFYPATLQSEENVYLRTDVNSTAFQTPGFDTGVQRNVAASQILAKIPLNNPTFAAVNEWHLVPATTGDSPVPAHSAVENVYLYERPFEVIYFTDNGNNEYSIMLNSKKISHIRLFVTDKFGRLIPAVSQQQINCGGLSFTASLRIDIFETPTMPQE